MNLIRTAEELAHALRSPPDPELNALLQAHLNRLAEWLEEMPLEQLAMFVIVQAGDTLTQVEAAIGRPLVGDGAATFAMPPEYVDHHGAWTEAVFILSDDGFGVVMLIEEGSDERLLAACHEAEHQH